MGFWGATVITSLFSAIPVVGHGVTTWLLGGFSVGDPTLTRFYALHYLLPFIIVAFVGAHLIALHKHGSNNPLGIDRETPQDSIAFHPYFTTKDLLGLAVFLVVFTYFVFYLPNYLNDPTDFIPANPLRTPSEVVPQWYFLPFFAILRSIPDKLMGVTAMFSAVAILGLVPWLDTSNVRSASFRPLYKWAFWLLVADVVLLGWVGAHRPEGVYVLIGRGATLYYFLHFLLLLPLLGVIERPRPLPTSIADVMRAKSGERLAAVPAQGNEP